MDLLDCNTVFIDMKHFQGKLDALKVIKETCEEHPNCEGCCFYCGENEDGVRDCFITDRDAPASWDLLDKPRVVAKLFK